MKYFAWFVLLCPWTLLLTALVVGLRKRRVKHR